jgi:hypothetical protein
VRSCRRCLTSYRGWSDTNDAVIPYVHTVPELGVTFEVTKAVNVNIKIFRDVTPFSRFER